MPLITVSDLSIRFRGPPLLDGVNCLIDSGERIGLLGRNGAGKTTLMKILAGQVEPDNGRAQIASGGKVALLPQDVPRDLTGSVRDVVIGGVQRSDTQDVADLAESDWESEHKVDQILSRMELDPAALVQSMSSGMKRRVLLAKALVDSPDVLLLDEPTNHLDIDAIRWLEDFLVRWPATLLFITHDRQFLRKLSTRILEIDGGRLFDWTCDYDTFLRRKEEALAAEDKQNALFDKRLAEEEVDPAGDQSPSGSQRGTGPTLGRNAPFADRTPRENGDHQPADSRRSPQRQFDRPLGQSLVRAPNRRRHRSDPR